MGTRSRTERGVMSDYYTVKRIDNSRLVKQAFRKLAQQGVVKILTKHVIIPKVTEIANNPRARSAKMRVVEKINSAEKINSWEPGPEPSAA